MDHSALPRRLWAAALMAAAMLATTATDAQPGGSGPGYQFDNYKVTELEAVCAAIAPGLYVSGLSDGAWFSLPGGGRTHFYRSACYLELARRTGRADVCPLVIERRSLLGDGSAYTPERCEQAAAAYREDQQKSALERTRYAQSVAGAFAISHFAVQPLPNRNWRLEVRADGTRPGDYVLEIRQIRDGKVLHHEVHTLTQTRTWVWELERTAIVGATPLPNIFPMSVSLAYRTPGTASRPAGEHITGIQNFTLSAE